METEIKEYICKLCLFGAVMDDELFQKGMLI